MKKVFYLKRKEQSQTYKLNLTEFSTNTDYLNLTHFSTDTDYKYILNLLSGGHHKNFINDTMTQCIAYDILCYYLSIRKSLHESNDEYCFTLFKRIIKEIGSLGLTILILELNKYLDEVFLIEDIPQKLNNFKI